eukprot:gene11194-2032_t
MTPHARAACILPRTPLHHTPPRRNPQMTGLRLAVAAAAVLPAAGAAGAPNWHFDVVVYGATPGGVATATAAGRQGAAVALLEPGLYIGGCMTGGLQLADYGMHAPRVIGGISEEFFRRVAAAYDTPFTWPADNQCGQHKVPWVSEPHVAEGVFNDMLASANVTVMMSSRVVSVATSGSSPPTIDSLALADTGAAVAATVFVDATYEGALMKMADHAPSTAAPPSPTDAGRGVDHLLHGVDYAFGRESNTTYNETTAGVLPGPDVENWPYGDRSAPVPRGISPYVDDTNTTLIPGVYGGPRAAPGQGDLRVGSFDWRVTLTDVPENMVPLPEPDHYDPAQFELQRRILNAGGHHIGGPPVGGVPNRKSDWKPAFGEHPNYQWGYPNGTWEEQQAVVAEFKSFLINLMHFYKGHPCNFDAAQVDPAVPENIRTEMAAVGLCKDEYNRTDHFMPQLYVRTALRMLGRKVLTQDDVVPSEWVDKFSDTIGVASYTVDIPGNVQMLAEKGEVVAEGSLK